jgi:catechol 2,3-dioxygenase-like lactoylglutathione lyase family enzyme
MRVMGLVWLGIPADDYTASVGFFRDVLGMDVAFDEGNTMELGAANGDKVQLFGPGHRYFTSYRSQGARMVPLFEFDDLETARTELASHGIETVGEPESDQAWTWLTFRGPDGNLHSLGARHGATEQPGTG